MNTIVLAYQFNIFSAYAINIDPAYTLILFVNETIFDAIQAAFIECVFIKIINTYKHIFSILSANISNRITIQDFLGSMCSKNSSRNKVPEIFFSLIHAVFLKER